MGADMGELLEYRRGTGWLLAGIRAPGKESGVGILTVSTKLEQARECGESTVGRGPEEGVTGVLLDVVGVEVRVEQIVQTTIAAGNGVDVGFVVEKIDDLDEKFIG